MIRQISILIILLLSIMGAGMYFIGCNLSQVEYVNEAPCCVSLYKSKWLDQKKKGNKEYIKLEACCTLQNKLLFCDKYKEKEKIEDCISRSKQL